MLNSSKKESVPSSVRGDISDPDQPLEKSLGCWHCPFFSRYLEAHGMCSWAAVETLQLSLQFMGFSVNFLLIV